MIMEISKAGHRLLPLFHFVFIISSFCTPSILFCIMKMIFFQRVIVSLCPENVAKKNKNKAAEVIRSRQMLLICVTNVNCQLLFILSAVLGM